MIKFNDSPDFIIKMVEKEFNKYGGKARYEKIKNELGISKEGPMTRDEKIEQLYQHLLTVMSPSGARAASKYVMKLIEAWPKD